MRQRGAGVAILVLGLMAAGCRSSPTPTTPSTSQIPASPGRHDVSISANGVTVGGYVYRPAGSDARPAVIVLHGWQPAGTNGAALVEARAKRFSDAGYVALAVSMRGWPPSGGADDCGLRQPDDIAAAANWLRTQAGVLPDRIGIVGFSQGGQVALLTGARDPRMRAVVAYFPVTDVARWKVTTANADIPGYITTVCEPGGVAQRSPVSRAGDIAAPVLLVHGDEDTRVPTEQSVLMRAALTAAGRRVELLLVPGAQHGFTPAEDALAHPVVDAFLARELR